MRLSNNDIKSFRSIIAEKLSQVPEGSQITIDKDLLERLLFDTIKDSKNGITAKFPVWSGIFLTKIANLNEISFDNIVLDPLNPDYVAAFPSSSFDDILKLYKDTKGHLIKYSKLGITIDISKSFTIIYYLHQLDVNPDVKKPVLTSVDLSGNNIIGDNKPCPVNSYFSLIFESDLSYSTAQITPNESIIIQYSNLTGLDLSNLTLSYRVLSSLGINNVNFYRSDLSETGINILTDTEDEKAKKALAEAIKDSHLTHCTINGIFIATKKEQEIAALQRKYTYEAYKKEILDKIDFEIMKAASR